MRGLEVRSELSGGPCDRGAATRVRISRGHEEPGAREPGVGGVHASFGFRPRLAGFPEPRELGSPGCGSGSTRSRLVGVSGSSS